MCLHCLHRFPGRLGWILCGRHRSRYHRQRPQFDLSQLALISLPHHGNCILYHHHHHHHHLIIITIIIWLSPTYHEIITKLSFCIYVIQNNSDKVRLGTKWIWLLYTISLMTEEICIDFHSWDQEKFPCYTIVPSEVCASLTQGFLAEFSLLCRLHELRCGKLCEDPRFKSCAYQRFSEENSARITCRVKSFTRSILPRRGSPV